MILIKISNTSNLVSGLSFKITSKIQIIKAQRSSSLKRFAWLQISFQLSDPPTYKSSCICFEQRIYNEKIWQKLHTLLLQKDTTPSKSLPHHLRSCFKRVRYLLKDWLSPIRDEYVANTTPFLQLPFSLDEILAYLNCWQEKKKARIQDSDYWRVSHILNGSTANIHTNVVQNAVCLMAWHSKDRCFKDRCCQHRWSIQVLFQNWGSRIGDISTNIQGQVHLF